MKTAFYKNTRREIFGSLSRFLSIFFIVALGVGFFTGVKTSAPDMRLSADTYYDEYHLMDLRLVSSTGFSAQDIENLEAQFPDATVNGGYYLDVLTVGETGSQVSRLLSWSSSTDVEQVNRVELKAGRYPEAPGECMVDSAKSINGKTVQPGDVLTFSGESDGTLSHVLASESYTVVGTFASPLYIDMSSRGNTSIGNGSIQSVVYLPESEFRSPVYTNVYLTFPDLAEKLCYSDAYRETLDAYKEKLSAAAPADALWFVFTRDDNPGYTEYGENADRVNNIAKVFPIFFLLVAALVCLTTMSRMVEEQRTQIGTMKALGYSAGAIASKYLMYAVSATVLGAAFGILVGMKIFPFVIVTAYSMLYYIPAFTAPYDLPLSLITVLIAVLAVSATVLAACMTELREQPAMLMRPKAPKSGKRVLLERITPLWKRCSFAWKVTLRNMFRYKRRMFMTTIGISGCTALTLTGFALHDSIRDVVALQYEEINIYSGLLSYQPTTDEERIAMESILSDAGQSYQYVYQKAFSFSHEEAQAEAYLTVPEFPEELSRYQTLRERTTKKPLTIPDGEVLINEKLSILLGNLSKGDTVTIHLSDTETRELTVAGIYENYTQHYVYMNPETYRKLLGGTPAYNLLYFSGEGLETDKETSALSERLLTLNCVQGVRYNNNMSETFSNMLKSLNLVIVVIIVSAGLLAFVVLYNLTNINITERIREIATIKVLGFYDGEVDAYIFRENLLLTLLGNTLGLGLGVALANYVIRTAEIDMVMFGRSIHGLSFLLASAITLLFSVIVALFMHRYLVKVNMVEALKSIE